jgi:glyoxylase-like metal-dependent hydrolase (beta-lactamase superfamily II)
MAAPLIVTAPLWLAATNCYVIAAERGGPAVVVDVPPDPRGVARLLAELDCYPAALLVTHGHVDHTGGTGAVAAAGGATAYLHPDDDWLARDPLSQLRAVFGFAEEADDYAPPEAFAPLADGRALEVAGLSFDVLHTPGHTPGHCCFHLAAEGILFSGDQLFAGSVGRTDLPGGDWDQLMTSMRDKVLALDDATDVLPGHGPPTTLARERAANPFLQGL